MSEQQAPKGTMDVTPADSYKWQYLENKFCDTCRRNGFEEIRTPVFEHTELFVRGVGTTTDVVQKEMYTFEDRGGRSISLKPEGTAGAVRAYLERKLCAGPLPVKLWYRTPVFRYEKPQAGRLREHHQLGVEVFGAASATQDAEVIALAVNFLRELGIDSLTVNINSIGCKSCRAEHRKQLLDYLEPHREELCETCRERMDRNPLRVFDCKSPICKAIVADAPKILDCLCDDCRAHFETLKACLDEAGIRYEVNPLIVRGLDYYTRTVFEIVYDGIGAQGTVCGGGRYDGLVEEIGGVPTPGMGFGMGIERLLLTLDGLGIELPKPALPQLYIGSMGAIAERRAFVLANALRKLGVACDCDHTGRGVKAQMRYANKLGFAYTGVIGEGELETGRVTLKRMSDGETVEVELTAEAIEKIVNS